MQVCTKEMSTGRKKIKLIFILMFQLHLENVKWTMLPSHRNKIYFHLECSFTANFFLVFHLGKETVSHKAELNRESNVQPWFGYPLDHESVFRERASGRSHL